MPEQLSTARYSTLVELHLLAQGNSYPLAQIASDFVIFRSPVTISPCEATIVMCVDGAERCWRITLPAGASRDSEFVKITRESEG